MKRRWTLAMLPAILLTVYFCLSHVFPPSGPSYNPIEPEPIAPLKTIQDTVGRGETFFDIFKKNGLNVADLFVMREAAADVHRLDRLNHGQKYEITVDDQNCFDSLVYWIDDEFVLKIRRAEDGFQAERSRILYESRILILAGSIEDNLVSSFGEGEEPSRLAMRLSDIFAWDIDFTSDLREGDAYALVAEGLYIDGELKKYGEILSASFVNNGKKHTAYRFEWDGKADYFDAEGNSLKKAFLRAPLSFRRISSQFSLKRFHPVLRVYRPHHGVDYAASRGTPVSATRDGRVAFAGRRGQYGKLVVVRHDNRYTTYYGHLTRFAPGTRLGARVKQGDVIGYVGATGLATGPHLHYEVRRAGRFVNPLTVQDVGSGVPQPLMTQFKETSARMERILASAPNRPGTTVLQTAWRGTGRTRSEEGKGKL